MSQKKKYKVAMVTLKKLIWNGKRKIPKGTVFKDAECFEGKYHPDTAEVRFLEPQSEPEDKSNGQERAEPEPKILDLESDISLTPPKRRGRPPKSSSGA
jgi:hypothetical protein